MAVVTMKQLLGAGVHFGHQTRRWNPKMRRFILGERNGIYLIDLRQTMKEHRGVLCLYPRPGRRRRHHLVRGHQEADPGTGSHLCRRLWHALRERAVVGRHADQLPDGIHPGEAHAGVRCHAKGRRLRRHAQEGGLCTTPREPREAPAQPGRHPWHRPPARCHLRDRHEEGAHRGDRGEQARAAHRGRGRHQLRRSRRHLPRDPGQRRCHSVGQPCLLRDRRGRGRRTLSSSPSSARPRLPLPKPQRRPRYRPRRLPRPKVLLRRRLPLRRQLLLRRRLPLFRPRPKPPAPAAATAAPDPAPARDVCCTGTRASSSSRSRRRPHPPIPPPPASVAAPQAAPAAAPAATAPAPAAPPADGPAPASVAAPQPAPAPAAPTEPVAASNETPTATEES